jgi:hypothetical protein
MEKNFKYWKEEDFDYWVNQKTNWVVKEISRGEEEQWVMLDNNGMMISCEWKINKEDCMEEADRIYSEELFTK